MLQPREFEALLHGIIDAVQADLGATDDSVRYLRHESVYCQLAVYEEMLRCGLRPGSHILEAGCGHGLLAFGLAVTGCEVTALDWYVAIDPEASRTAAFARQAAGQPLSIRFIRQNLGESDWSVAPAAFDMVVSVDVIEHVANAVFFMQNCVRALAPGGHCVIHTPNYGSLARRYGSLKSVLRPVWPTDLASFTRENPWYGHVREYNAAELPLLMQSFGLEVSAQRFPMLHDVNRLRTDDGKLPLRRRVFHAVTEVARRLRPSLGPVQLVVARHPADS